MQSPLFWLIPVSSLLALGVAAFFYSRMKAASEGTAKMAEIASHVRAGAMAYLRQQYKVVGISAKTKDGVDNLYGEIFKLADDYRKSSHRHKKNKNKEGNE